MAKLRHAGVKVVFDVGANIGDWAKLCRQNIPAAHIHCFEIAPPVFTRLQKNIAGLGNITANSFGISDETKELTVYYPEGFDFLTSAYPGAVGKDFTVPTMPVPQVRQIKGKVVRADEYVAGQGIKQVDFLKIDVEGMEESVLRGFTMLLRQHRVRLIQFEYNTPSIVARFMLRDAHALLEGHGYKMGKLYPNYVEFRDYHYRHEDFCGPNMIAVRSEDAEIIRLLS